MKEDNKLTIKPGRAICYSGFREAQWPGGNYPSYEEVKEDLLILHGQWQYLRLYDCDEQAEKVLQVIKDENLDFKIMLGAHIDAEVNNFGCPWGGTYPEEVLEKNKTQNRKRITTLIQWANTYPDIIWSLSAGNEACVDWTDHYVPVETIVEYVQLIKKGAKQPVTFCENYVPWLHKLKPLVDVVDFISIHTYPVWEYRNIHEAMEYTKQNYYAVADTYPDKPVIITEAGWTTMANGNGIDPNNVSEEHQAVYLNDLLQWSDQANVLTFVFEAFDEPWKGSSDYFEPEKHWGLYRVDRTPKRFMKNSFVKV